MLPYLTGEKPEGKTVVQFSGTDAAESVILTQRVHPFPFRTRKLSSAVPIVLCWGRHGRVGHGRHRISLRNAYPMREKHHGGVAQLGEHLPCKQGVMGSNPIISTKQSRKTLQSKVFRLCLIECRDSNDERHRATIRWIVVTASDQGAQFAPRPNPIISPASCRRQ